MQIDLSELFPAVGMKKTVEVPFERKEFRWNGNVYPVTEAGPVVLELSRTGGRIITVSGSADLALEAPCDRCLTPVRLPFHLSLEAEIPMEESGTEHTEELDEMPFVQGRMLDTDLLVCDELFVNMPMKVLCSPDCLGVCPKCGCNRNIRDCGCDLFEPDPRMSVIRDLFHANGENGS